MNKTYLYLIYSIIFIYSIDSYGQDPTVIDDDVEVNGYLRSINPGSSSDGSKLIMSSPQGYPGFVIMEGDGAGNVESRWDAFVRNKHFVISDNINYSQQDRFIIKANGNTHTKKLRVLPDILNDNFHTGRLAAFHGADHGGNGWIEVWGNDGKQAGILFGNPTDEWQGRIHWDDNVKKMAFYAEKNEVMSFNKAGELRVSAPSGTKNIGRITVFGTGENNDGTREDVGLGGAFVSGTADAAKFGRYAVGITSWNGIGFASSQNGRKGIVFDTRNASAFFEGKVGIGTDNPKNKLSVNGTIWAKKVKVTMEDAADWVFEEDYELRSLEEVEAHITKYKHLPDMPSAEEFKENDMDLAEMNNKLLQKIEELTLYLIEQNKEIETLKAKLETKN